MWPYGIAAINVESAVALSEAQALRAGGKLTGIRRWAYHEGGIVVKAAICGENMQMGMKKHKGLHSLQSIWYINNKRILREI